jgi:hypothetical protein
MRCGGPALTEPIDFGVDDARVAELAGTRQGRVSQAGFCYQAAYAVARLASMHTGKPVLSLSDVPRAMRYDWAEDLDEVLIDGRCVFTECKRIEDIGQPAKLADVLLNFVPKFLWTTPSKRSSVLFRLVCTDRRFSTTGPSNLQDSYSENDKASVLNYMQRGLRTSPTGDRLKWQHEANAFGLPALAEVVWSHTEVLYVDGTCHTVAPGPLFQAEIEDLELWVSAC